MDINLEKDSLIKLLESSFGYQEEIRPRRIYRVKFNGKFVVTASKKTVWTSLGAAKSAILTHIVSYCCYRNINRDEAKKMRDTLEEFGCIEYVAL